MRNGRPAGEMSCIWPIVKRLDAFLQFNEEDILHDKGKVTAAIAKAFAEKEFEKFSLKSSGFCRIGPIRATLTGWLRKLRMI